MFLKRPWVIAVFFGALIVVGIIWWLSLHDWRLSSIANLSKLSFSGQSADSVNFEGVYEMEGPAYTAKLSIRRAGQGYSLSWVRTTGETYYGNGVACGNVLGVGFDMPSVRGKRAGIAAYKKDGPNLSGLWTGVGSDKLSYEKTKNAPRILATPKPLVGTYSVQGTNPNGSSYTSQIAFSPTGSTLEISWQIDSLAIWGTGFILDDVLVAGYNNSMGLGLTVYSIRDSVFDGRWLYTDFERLAKTSEIRVGKEKAKRSRIIRAADSVKTPQVVPSLGEP